MNQKHYEDYLKILKEELVPAMGCTEPIAIAYAAAVARKELGSLPDRVEIQVSGNIIKNVKSVIVPNTGGLRGIEAAAAAGIVVGDPELELRVIAEVEEKEKQKIYDFINSVPISVEFADNGNIFDIMVTLYAKEESSYIRICGFHTNIVILTYFNNISVETADTYI